MKEKPKICVPLEENNQHLGKPLGECAFEFRDSTHQKRRKGANLLELCMGLVNFVKTHVDTVHMYSRFETDEFDNANICQLFIVIHHDNHTSTSNFPNMQRTPFQHDNNTSKVVVTRELGLSSYKRLKEG